MMQLMQIGCILSITLPFVLSDTFRFASHYANHMVLQRDPSRSIIWGFGDVGATVVVNLLGIKYTTDVVKGK